MLVSPVKYCNSLKDLISLLVNTLPRSVTAAASASLSSPSPLVSQLATHSALTAASANWMIGLGVTITVHEADSQLLVSTQILVVPALTPSTTPSDVTVAILSSSDLQVKVDTASDGIKVGVSFMVSPSNRFIDSEANAIDSGAGLTYTVLQATRLLAVTTFILVVPTFTPSIMPFA